MIVGNNVTICITVLTIIAESPAKKRDFIPDFSADFHGETGFDKSHLMTGSPRFLCSFKTNNGFNGKFPAASGPALNSE
ncbi:hypothetical protein MJA45_24990 [Paenibacillus aurantius]|uniref:Uncharacterized protein n=1 Tax=Paenibacillus aurantius TaxID=2918900 RepID=A0AA96LCU3_9BACL|nr:hypothetical protein [Paenibacillus aurantius]WNQ10838.1 hypothetical protein MJA45_24990 [Paenibacillus aurantius]